MITTRNVSRSQWQHLMHHQLGEWEQEAEDVLAGDGTIWMLTHSHIWWLWWLWDGWDFSCCYWPEHLYVVLHVDLHVLAFLIAWWLTSENECPKGTMWTCKALLWPHLWSDIASLNCTLLVKAITKVFPVQREGNGPYQLMGDLSVSQCGNCMWDGIICGDHLRKIQSAIGLYRYG